MFSKCTNQNPFNVAVKELKKKNRNMLFCCIMQVSECMTYDAEKGADDGSTNAGSRKVLNNYFSPKKNKQIEI